MTTQTTKTTTRTTPTIATGQDGPRASCVGADATVQGPDGPYVLRGRACVGAGGVNTPPVANATPEPVEGMSTRAIAPIVGVSHKVGTFVPTSLKTIVKDRQVGTAFPPEPVDGHVPDAERARLAASFGRELRSLRLAAGVTQARLADLAGLYELHVLRLELGRRRPTVWSIRALVRCLVPAGELDVTVQRLAAAAGESLREGSFRKKQAVAHRKRRAAVDDMEKLARQSRALVRAAQGTGAERLARLARQADALTAVARRMREQLEPGRDDDDDDDDDGAPAVRDIGMPVPPAGLSMRAMDAWCTQRLATLIRSDM